MNNYDGYQVPWTFIPHMRERAIIKKYGSCWRNCGRGSGGAPTKWHSGMVF